MKFVLLIIGLSFSVYSSAQGYWKRVHGNGIVPVPSTVGTYSPTNSPFGRYASACMIDSSGSFWLYSGDGYHDLWRYDPDINQWMLVNGNITTVMAPVYGTQGVAAIANQPGGATFGHPSWGDHLGNLWIFGPNSLNDMWKYNIATDMWTWVKGNNSVGPAVFGTKGVPSAATNPGMCNETDCHWTDSNGDLWLYTEFNGNLWRFDPVTEMWTWINGNGAAPVYGTIDVFDPLNTPGSFSACPSVGTLYTMWITSDDHLWMVVNRSDFVNGNVEMWEYNPVINQWRCRRIDSQPLSQTQVFPTSCDNNDSTIFPAIRTEMRAEWVDNCDHLYLFGGGEFCWPSSNYNDMWRYDPSTNNYTYIRGGTAPMVPGIQGIFDPNNSPPDVSGSQAWQNENGFYLMGGQNGTGSPSDDVWLYSPDTVVANFSYLTNCNTVNFTNLSSTGCNYIKTVTWDFGDNSTSNLENPVHTYSGNGNYEVTLVVENCSWSTDTFKQNIQINCGLSIQADSDTICNGDCIDLVVNTSSNPDSLTYTWFPSLPNNDTVQVCPSTTTSYTVIATDVNGYTDTAISQVVIMQPPIVDLGGDTVICGGSLLLDAGNPGAIYQWQDGSTGQTYVVNSSGVYFVTVDNGGCLDSDSISVQNIGPEVNLGNDTSVCNINLVLDAGNLGATYLWQDFSTNQQFIVSDTGVYHVAVTDANGCTVNDTIEVAAGDLTVDLGADTTLCHGDTLTLNAGNPGSSYLWSDGNTGQFNTVNSNAAHHVFVTNGICTGADSILLNFDILEVNFDYEIIQNCDVSLVTFSNLTIGNNIAQWYWDFGDNSTSKTKSPNHTFTQAGTYAVTLMVETLAGCEQDTAILMNIDIYPTPLAKFSFLPKPPQLDEPVQFNDESKSAQNWLWDFGDLGISELQHPSHTFPKAGDYTVTLIVTNHDCTDTARVYLGLEEELIFYVPNSFTPDGDQFNNQFQPVFTSGYNPYDYHLTIFNRWGEVIFESFDSEIGWDGHYPKCNLVKDGLYIWQIEFGNSNNDKRHLYRGSVTLLH